MTASRLQRRWRRDGGGGDIFLDSPAPDGPALCQGRILFYSHDDREGYTKKKTKGRRRFEGGEKVRIKRQRR